MWMKAVNETILRWWSKIVYLKGTVIKYAKKSSCSNNMYLLLVTSYWLDAKSKPVDVICSSPTCCILSTDVFTFLLNSSSDFILFFPLHQNTDASQSYLVQLGSFYQMLLNNNISNRFNRFFTSFLLISITSDRIWGFCYFLFCVFFWLK